MRYGLRDLRALAVLAEERHFGRAAERLGMTQPHLSQLVARTEQAVGVTIFVRRPTVTPTPAGAAVIAAAQQVLTDFEKGLDAARRIQAGRQGIVRLGMVQTVMLTDLTDIFGVFRAANPDVQLLFAEDTSMALAEAVETGTLDFAFARQTAPFSGVSSLCVHSEPFVAVHSEGLKLNDADFDPRHLREEPFILFPRHFAPHLYEEIVDVCARVGFVPGIAHQAKGWLAALAMVRAGLGVTVGPACIRQLDWPGLVFRDLRPDAGSSKIFMLWKETAENPAAGALVRLVTEKRAAYDPSRT